MARPWPRFHIPLIEPNMQISRIRLSDKSSRVQRCFGVAPPAQDYEVVGVSNKATAKTLLKPKLLPSQHKPAHVKIRQQW